MTTLTITVLAAMALVCWRRPLAVMTVALACSESRPTTDTQQQHQGVQDDQGTAQWLGQMHEAGRCRARRPDGQPCDRYHLYRVASPGTDEWVTMELERLRSLYGDEGTRGAWGPWMSARVDAALGAEWAELVRDAERSHARLHAEVSRILTDTAEWPVIRPRELVTA